MDDDVDLSNIILHIFEKQRQNGSDSCVYTDKFKSVNIGKTYLIKVLVKYPSCLNGNVNAWKERIGNLNGHVNICTKKSLTCDEQHELVNDSGYFQCNFFHSVADKTPRLSADDQLQQPYFVNNTTFVVPLAATVNNIRSLDKKVYLTVTIVKSVKCPKKMFGEYDFLLNQDDVKPVPEKEKYHTQKSVSRTLRVHQPPKLKVKYKDVSGQFMVFLDLSNSSMQDIVITDVTLLKGSCPACDKAASQHRDVYTDISACKGCDHAIQMMSGSNFKFPVMLYRGESLSLIFTLYKHNIETDFSELVLNTHVKWGTELNEPQAVTVYRMPKLKFRKVPFVLDVDCDRKSIAIGESFKVTYTVTNILQDFQEWKLYWNPMVPKDCKENEKFNKEMGVLSSGLLCHHPVIQFGKLSFGSTVTAKVEFTILNPGLYELGKHMKLNLTYDVPESPVKEVKKQLLGSPEGLWRDRISSASSYAGDRELEEKRLSFGKSYSFGDLGPDGGSQESDHYESIKLNTDEVVKRMVVSSDFKKNSFQIYVPVPDY